MRCTFDKPTIQDCLNCQFSDCIRSETSDVLVYIKRWAEKHPEKFKELQRRKNKRYRETHKESERIRRTEWNHANPERSREINRKAGKKYREAHREKERERNRLNYLKRKRERQAV